MQTIELHPKFLSKSGEKEFAMIPYVEFMALKEWIADMQDLLDLEDAIRIEENTPGIPLEELEQRFGVAIS